MVAKRVFIDAGKPINEITDELWNDRGEDAIIDAENAVRRGSLR